MTNYTTDQPRSNSTFTGPVSIRPNRPLICNPAISLWFHIRGLPSHLIPFGVGESGELTNGFRIWLNSENITIIFFLIQTTFTLAYDCIALILQASPSLWGAASGWIPFRWVPFPQTTLSKGPQPLSFPVGSFQNHWSQSAPLAY